MASKKASVRKAGRGKARSTDGFAVGDLVPVELGDLTLNARVTGWDKDGEPSWEWATTDDLLRATLWVKDVAHGVTRSLLSKTNRSLPLNDLKKLKAKRRKQTETVRAGALAKRADDKAKRVARVRAASDAGTSPQEIARETGLSVDQVKRAKRALR